METYRGVFPGHRVIVASLGCCLLLIISSDLLGQPPMHDDVSGDFLDQSFEEDFSDPRYENQYSLGQSNDFQEWAQSFTVGRDGLFSHVEVYGNALWSTDVTVDICRIVDGEIGPVLGSRTLWPGNPVTKTWDVFDFRAAAIEVRQGDQLAIAISGRFNWISSLWGDPVRTYSGGSIYHRTIQDSGGTPTIPIGQWHRLDHPFHARNDFMFRTFVIPEPTSIALTALGTAGGLIVRRRADR